MILWSSRYILSCLWLCSSPRQKRSCAFLRLIINKIKNKNMAGTRLGCYVGKVNEREGETWQEKNAVAGERFRRELILHRN